MFQTSEANAVTEINISSISSKSCETSPEYSIYTYDFFEDTEVGCNRWQLVGSGADLERVKVKAKAFYESGNYQRIEIKKKFYNNRTKSLEVETYRSYGRCSHQKIMSFLTAGILAFASAGLVYLNF